MRQSLPISFFVLLVAACNPSPKTGSGNEAGSHSKTEKSFSWTQEDERDFLAGCVDNAKAKLGDTLAFAQCNCVLGKLKESFPSLDSASAVLMDSTKAAAFANKCK